MHYSKRIGSYSILVVLYLLCFSQTQAAIIINEFLASNRETLADPQGQYDDWIELHNTGRTSVNLAGMGLTDDLEDTVWYFPLDQPELTTISPGEYLIVWADGDFLETGLHADFKLSAKGDAIYLLDRDAKTVLDSVVFDRQHTDVSTGRSANDPETWHVFEQASPGQANGQGHLGIVAEPKCSYERGLYQDPFTLALSTETAGAQILYTLDGSDPMENDRGGLYHTPITIDRTTCLRVVALRPDWITSRVITHTYIFPSQVIYQTRPEGYPREWFSSGQLIAPSGDYQMDPDIYNDPQYRDLMEASLGAIPTISLVTDKDHLFSSKTGIYMNPRNHGVAWERPCSFEWITPDAAPEIQVNCGLRIQGGHTRLPEKNPKHSFRVNFKSDYGPSKLRLPLFGDDATDTIDQLILRAGGNQSWLHHNTFKGDNRGRAQYVRDQWAKDVQIAMGRPGTANTYAHLYINGLYWGLYNPTERPNAAFAAAYLGGDKEDYDALNSGEVIDGTAQRWNQLFQLANQGLSDPDAYGSFQQWLDIDSFIDYMIINLFGANLDWDHHNWYAFARHTPPGPFQFACWDNEFIFINDTEEGVDTNRLNVNEDKAPGRLFQRLRQNSTFRMQFADRVHEHFFHQGLLTVDQVVNRWNSLSEQVEIPLIAEAARWGDYRRDVHPRGGPTPIPLYHPRGAWADQQEELRTHYFPYRSQIVLDQFREAGLYPQIAAPIFRVNGQDQYGGSVDVSDRVSLHAPVGSIYYTLDGSDPWLPTSTGTVSREVWISEDATKRVFVPTAPISNLWNHPGYNDSNWVTTRGGVGYERSFGYESLITLDLESFMYNQHTGCFIRIPFSLNQTQLETTNLNLNIRYDDGFIAYLNGQEIARRNANSNLWNASATANHTDSEAKEIITFDISNTLSLLVKGQNLLAIHGLNYNATSSDFLISAELSAGGRTEVNTGIIAPEAFVYTDPINLEHSTEVKARAFDGRNWSALSHVKFDIRPN